MNYITDALRALCATCGSALLFRVPQKELFAASLGGAVGWSMYLIVKNSSHSETVAALIASIAVAVYAETIGFLKQKPATLYSTCAIIPLVPGAGMYYTMFEAVQGSAEKAWATGFATLSTAGAIAAGLAIVASLTRIIKLDARRLKKSRRD